MAADPKEKLHFDPKQKCCGVAAIGAMFPDLLKLDLNTINRGRVFSVHIRACGLGVQERSVLVDQTAWEKCVTSPHFRQCYDLSLARLALQQGEQRY